MKERGGRRAGASELVELATAPESLSFELFALDNKNRLVSRLLTFKATYVYIVRRREGGRKRGGNIPEYKGGGRSRV